MKFVTTLAAAACMLTSVPMLAGAQAPASPEPQAAPQTQTQTAPQSEPQTQPQTQAQPASPATSASAATAPDAAMQAVNCELVSKLDSKTAKTGDSIVVKTRSAVKTADGTEIPKGSKLSGHITAVKASGDTHENSEVALAFDTAELKGGQSVPIHSEIQSLSPAGGSSASDASMGAGSSPSAPSAPSAGGSAPSGMNGSGGGATASSGGGSAQQMPSSPSSSGAPAQASGPAPGTVVATTGNIAIRATAIPGIMLAGNQPGQRDPRMGQSSGILLGAKQDIRLDGGTEMVLNVSPASGTGGTR